MLEAAQWQTPTPARAEPADLLGVEMNAVGEPGPRSTSSRSPPADRPAARRTSPGRTAPRPPSRRDGCEAGSRSARRAARFRSSVAWSTENGEHGASATRIRRRASGRGTASAPARCRRGSSSSSCTTASGGRPPSFGRTIHRAARHRHAHAERARLLDLDVDRVLEPGGIEIVMVGRGRAARQHQLGQREPRRERADGSASAAPRSDRARSARETAPC